MPADKDGTNDYAELQTLLTDPGLWASAAEVLRSKLKSSSLRRKNIEAILGLHVAR